MRRWTRYLVGSVLAVLVTAPLVGCEVEVDDGEGPIEEAAEELDG